MTAKLYRLCCLTFAYSVSDPESEITFSIAIIALSVLFCFWYTADKTFHGRGSAPAT